MPPFHTTASLWKPTLRALAGTAVLAALLTTAFAHASFPADPPNDPLYAHAGGCPPAFPTPACAAPSGQWNLYSYWPNNPPARHASGISADLAWQVTTGRPDVVVDVLDSGVNYDHEDLRNKIWLNRGELPVPNGPACGPPASDPYDCNNDGVFNVQDYAGDSRLTDTALPGVLSRSDLRGFENGFDDDGNGFVDDISGWDARDNDGDEYMTNNFSHGTGRNGFIGAETNNGTGIAGICPRCPLANVRVDGTFVTRTESVGIGAIWAADHGHEVINMALGGTSASSLTRAAFDYATRHNVLALNAMANEFSFHQNLQTVFDDVMGIGAVVPDTFKDPNSGQESEVTTYLRKANFSNYGAHMDVMAPSDSPTTGGGMSSYGDSSGTSSAVPQAAGVAALVISRARDLIDLGVLNTSPLALKDLSAQEVRQIIDRTADDIVKADDPAGPYNYLTGWDRWSGYGRVNAKKAVDKVGAGTIPPEADINAPDWYSQVNGTTDVQFYANARWAGSYNWVLEYGGGVEPSSFTAIASGSDASDPAISSASLVSNFSRSWNTSALPSGFYTLRLRVTDNLGNQGEDRMGVWVQPPDPQERAGWPRGVNGSIESVAGGALVDLNGDNKLEIIFSTGDGEVHALQEDGTELAGFPLHSDPAAGLPTCCSQAFDGNAANGEVPITGSSIIGGVTVADIDGDGVQEICAGAYNGKLYCWNADGSPQPGFPVETDKGITVDQYSGALKSNAAGEALLTPPAVADLDGDGKMELVAGAFDQKLYVWHSDGTRLAPWPLAIYDASSASGVDPVSPKEIISHPLVADIDNDGTKEIVFGTNETYSSPNVAGIGGSGRVYAYRPDGTLVPGWPVKPASVAPSAVPLVADGAGTSPIAADIDGDGTLEIAVGVFAGDAVIYNHDGTVFQAMSGGLGSSGPGGDGDETTPEGGLGKASDTPLHYYVAGGAFGQVDADGQVDYAVGMLGNGILAFATGDGTPTPFDHYLALWDAASGLPKPAFPRVIEDWPFFTGPAVADIDGAPGGLPELIMGSGGNFIHAFNALGVEPAGWPKNVRQWIVMTPTIGDIDGDGQLEVVAGTRGGELHVWETPGAACGNIQWRKALHDEWNTGVLGTDTLRPNAIRDLSAVSGPAGGNDTLSWTAPGDDGACGQAIRYQVRRSASPITPDDWNQAVLVPNAIAPQGAGGHEAMSLPKQTASYYYAVRTVDDAGNMSALSSVAFLPGPDQDGDGIWDSAEQACGGDAANPALRPERVDGPYAGVDDDGDGLIDEALPPNSETFDCDGDGFTGLVERYVFDAPDYRSDQRVCGGGWPLDMDDNGFVNVADILRYKGKMPGAVTPATRRLDLNADNSVNVVDVLKYKGKTPSACG